MCKILGIVVARGGSKRVPGKNIRDFLGKPLIEWTIEIGQKSEVFERFILITDDDKASMVGKKLGIEIPFKEPAELASDTAKIFDVFHYTLSWLRDNDSYNPEWFILLEPASPGRQVFHIQEVVKIIEEGGGDFDSICGISQSLGNTSAFKAMKRISDGSLVGYCSGKSFLELARIKNQDVPPSFFINSQIYAFKTANLFSEKDPSLWGNKTYGYIMDLKYAMDIDTEDDWVVAEGKMKALLGE